MRVVMIGATGLVGRALADRLIAGGVDVVVIGRRSLGRTHPNLREHLAAADHWPEIVRACPANVAISALGTTWRATGSQTAFRAVDLDMVVAFANAVRSAGGERFVTVSAIGANAASRNFYLRTKGEMEAALQRIGFDRLDMLQPGLLRGNRGGDRRLAERLGIALSPLTNLVMRGGLSRLAAIDAATVADAAAECLQRTDTGVSRHDNRSLQALASAHRSRFI